MNEFALDFIARHKEKPFFLYYPMILTHDPFQPTPDGADWDPKAEGEKVNRQVKHFADMAAYMDKMIGRVDAKLAELGVRDNTLLIFIGDNGTHPTVTSRFRGADYQGGKGTTTSRGTHVPMVVSWPGVIRQGRVSRDLISSADFLPTLCAAAGVTPPADINGVSFLPQLKGLRGTPREQHYCWYSPRQRQDLAVKEFAFDHDYKLYRDGRFFDLQADPFEARPLEASQRSGAAAAAEAKLRAALKQFDDARPAALDRTFRKQYGRKKKQAGKRDEKR